MRPRPLSTLLVLAVTATACGGSLSPLGSVTADAVLSACAPSGTPSTTTVVAADGARPAVAEMEATLSGDPDAQFVIDDDVEAGLSREDALHAMYAQVVGERLVADATELPGFVSAAIGDPVDGEPFRLVFTGDLPEQFDAGAYDLGSYGLEVVTGAAGVDEDEFSTAFAVADRIGIRVTSGWLDPEEGTGTIEVVDATPEQVAAWEEQVPVADQVCLVRAPRSAACVDAEQRSDDRPDVPPIETDEPLTPDQADRVTAGYVGLTLDDARARAAREGRAARVVVEDGVERGREDDFDPHRVNLTTCDGVVTAARVDAQL